MTSDCYVLNTSCVVWTAKDNFLYTLLQSSVCCSVIPLSPFSVTLIEEAQVENYP